MPTISVPVSGKLEEKIEELIKKGVASNKAEVMRKALELLAEEEAINTVLKSEQEAAEGKIIRRRLKGA